MKIKKIVGPLLALALAAGCVSEQHKQEKLQAAAKLSRADAEKIALGQVPNGTIKDGELEKEHGKVIYSFDIAVSGSSDIKEVAVDAINGQVISVETETPEQQAKEAAEDAKKEKKKKDND